MPKMKYEYNDGTIGFTNVKRGFDSPEVYGVEPAGVGNANFYARKSGSRRQKGVQPRRLVCSRNDGGLTPGGQQPKKFAYPTVGTLEVFDNVITIGQEINLPDGVYTVDAKIAEG